MGSSNYIAVDTGVGTDLLAFRNGDDGGESKKYHEGMMFCKFLVGKLPRSLQLATFGVQCYTGRISIHTSLCLQALDGEPLPHQAPPKGILW